MQEGEGELYVGVAVVVTRGVLMICEDPMLLVVVSAPATIVMVVALIPVKHWQADQ